MYQTILDEIEQINIGEKLQLIEVLVSSVKNSLDDSTVPDEHVLPEDNSINDVEQEEVVTVAIKFNEEQSSPFFSDEQIAILDKMSF